MLSAILVSCILLGIGLVLRASLKPLRVLFIPASVVAGLIGLALVQWSMRSEFRGDFTSSIVIEWRSWLTNLIAVIFAAMLLEGGFGGGFGNAIKQGARSGICAWIIILGQIIIGIGVYLFIVKPNHPEVPAGFSQLLEVSWAGGHGASTTMGDIYSKNGFEAGRDLAFFLSTFGLIYGVLSGLIFVNIAIRKGWVANRELSSASMLISGLEPADNPKPAMLARSRTEVIDPLTLQFLLLAAAFGLGILFRWLFAIGLQQAVFVFDPATQKKIVDATGNLPIFMFTLIGGWAVRWVLTQVGWSKLIDVDTLRRIVGVVMDFMIVAAIATMRIDAVSTYFTPIFFLILFAAIWSVITLFWVCRKLLPKEYWFELGLLNFGFSTANTAQGFMLLRIIDPELKTQAAEDYAVAAPLTAPFVGGGVITFVGLPLLLSTIGPAAIAICAMLIMIALYFLGVALARNS